MKRNHITFISDIAKSIGIPYLANSFILLNFNFATWSKGDRFMVVIIAVIIGFILGFMRAGHK